MDDRGVHSKLVRWLNERTSLLVIKADQGGEEPALPYIVVRFTGSNAVRDNAQNMTFEDLETLNSQGLKEVKATPIVETEWRFSIHAHGGEMPSDYLRPLRSAAELTQVTEPLWPGLQIHELSQIRNVPEFINEVWEHRAQMDLFVRGLTRDGFVIDPIETYSFDIGRA